MISRVTICYYSESLDSELNLWWSISSLMLSSTGRKQLVWLWWIMIRFISSPISGLKASITIVNWERRFRIRAMPFLSRPWGVLFFGARGFFAKTVINTANIHEFLDTPHLKQDSSTQQLFEWSHIFYERQSFWHVSHLISVHLSFRQIFVKVFEKRWS